MSDNIDWLPAFKKFIKFLKIQSKDAPSGLDGAGSDLRLFGSQMRFLEEMAAGLAEGVRVFYCLKSRQLGVTTISLAIDVFFLAMFPGTRAALVVDESRNAESFRRIVELYVKSFPDGFFGDKFNILKNNRVGITFSNNSQLDFLVAGLRDRESFGDGGGYSLAHFTEVGRYGCPGALLSFRNALSEHNPNRLYIYESRAEGPNHWKDMWEDAEDNPYLIRRFFIGWWSRADQRIPKSSPRFAQYGTYPPNEEERTLIAQVRESYGFTVDMEQLAWYRERANAKDMTLESMHAQQPWTEAQAFVTSGFSYFPIRMLQQDWDRIGDPVSGTPFAAYEYVMGDSFFETHIRELGPEDPPQRWQSRVWEKPVRGAKYVIGMDPAYGRNDWKDNHCLHQDAEILTKQGWKRYDQVETGDEAVCFDPETEAYSYGVVSDKIVKDYDGPMRQFKSKALDSQVTPEHRVVSRFWHPIAGEAKGPWQVATAEETSQGGNSAREIPTGGAPTGSGVPGLSDDVCRALGWILTDGHVTRADPVRGGPREGKRARRSSIALVQAVNTEKDGRNISSEMQQLMRHLCPDATMTIRKATQKNRADQLYCSIGVEESERFLAWLGPDTNRIPRDILVNGSEQQLKAIFQGILEGDGGWCKTRKKWVKVCPGLDSGFADDIQELAARLGYSATKTVQKAGDKGGPQWLVMLSTRKAHTFKVHDIKEVPYSGKVWCVTVPTGAFVARQNGKMFVTGNCVSVWRCFSDKLVQVAEYAWADDLTRHATWVLAHLAGNYEDCIINLEITGPGAVVMQELDSLRAELRKEAHTQMSQDRGLDNFLSSARWYLYQRPDSMGKGFVYNTKTGFESKRRVLQRMKDDYFSRVMLINSKPLVEEMMSVKQDNNEIGAPGRGKDDRVMAAAFAVSAWREWVQPGMLQMNLNYEDVMRRENGDLDTGTDMVGSLVRNYLKRVEAEADEPPPETWAQARGFS